MRTLIALLSIHLYGATPSIPDAQALLERSDSVRNGGDSFARAGQHPQLSKTARPTRSTPTRSSRRDSTRRYVEFLSPREKGRHLLMLGDDMWVFLPDTSRPIRITPLERLSGQASNGDVARTHYALDYDATYLRGETVDGVACAASSS